jgi:hypothetical protein
MNSPFERPDSLPQELSALRHAEDMVNTARAAVPTGQSTTTTSPFASEAIERPLKELRTLMQAPPSWVSVAEQRTHAENQ